MTESISRLERYELVRSKEQWLGDEIKKAIPGLPENYKNRFEYNDLYDFWRRSYSNNSRRMIRDYEALAPTLSLPEPYRLSISYGYLYVQKDTPHDRNDYHRMIADIPMDSPIEPEAFTHTIWNQKDIGLSCWSFTNLSKTQAFHGYEKMPMQRLEAFLSEWLVPLGYTLRMFFKGKGQGTEYYLGFTHNSESPDKFIEVITANGYRPYGEPKSPPKKKESVATVGESLPELERREAELLKELAEVQRAKGRV
jgi:hypothetical protein